MVSATSAKLRRSGSCARRPSTSSSKYFRYSFALGCEIIRTFVRAPKLPLFFAAKRFMNWLYAQSSTLRPVISEIRAPASNKVLAIQSSLSFHPEDLPAA